MLEVHVAAGKAPRITPDVTAAIREALARPTGVASYGDIVDWLWKEHSIRLASDKPVKIWTQDESRWGLMTILRRRITLKGVKPIITTQHQYANCWLYGAVAPQRGERFFLFLPRLDTMNMQIFLDMFAGAHPDTLNVMLMDRSGAHTAKHLGIPATTALVFFAPACPELNPTERVWEDLHGKLAGQCCAHLDCLEEEICAHLDLYTDPAVQSLTG